MREGLIASGLGHAALFGWALVAGVFDDRASPPDFQVTEVSVISTAEFEAIASAAPQTEPLTPTLAQPDTETSPPTPPQSTQAPNPGAPPAPTKEPSSERQPNALTPPEPTDVAPEAPTAPAPPASDPTLPELAKRPTPRPAPRVASTPAPAPPPDAEIAPVAQEAPKPTQSQDAVAEEAPRETAPQEAATEIVTEAEIPSRAPQSSSRPARRPAPRAPADVPQVPNDSLADAIADAIGSARQDPGAASGPPLTAAETDGFRLSVQRCWNVGSLSSAALRTRVTIGFDMNRDGTPVASSLRMVGFEGETEAAARQAYEAGRRAIIRCGASGFDLPVEKFEQWRQIEMTFNPEQMRIR